MLPDSVPAASAVQQLAAAYRISQAVYTAAILGLADLLVEGPQTAEELACAADAHAPSLYRLLRALASIGIFAEDAERRFSLTPRAEALRTDSPGSLRYFVLMVAGPENRAACAEMLHSVRTGEPAFQEAFGMSAWEYRQRHPEVNAIYNAGRTDESRIQAEAIVAAYDFSGLDRIVDVGGGEGALLAAVLRTQPVARGVLFDQPHVVAGAAPVLAHAGVAERCQIVGGDFFGAVPAAADAYLLKYILHDWGDDQARDILQNCRRAISDRGRLLVIEYVIAPGNSYDWARWMDITMLLNLGGRERTAAEFRDLFSAAGFSLNRIVPTQADLQVIEGLPA